LEEAAKRKGQSLSQEIEQRLAKSFEVRKDKDPYVDALAYLIGQVALMLILPGDLKSNPFKHEAFRTAVLSLLERLTPPGPGTLPDISNLPPELADLAKEPRAVGALTAEIVWRQLRTMPSPPPGMTVESGTWLYAYPNARRDLGVDFDVTGYNRTLIATLLMENEMKGHIREHSPGHEERQS
jgi:hypothetical protein